MLILLGFAILTGAVLALIVHAYKVNDRIYELKKLLLNQKAAIDKYKSHTDEIIKNDKEYMDSFS